MPSGSSANSVTVSAGSANRRRDATRSLASRTSRRRTVLRVTSSTARPPAWQKTTRLPRRCVSALGHRTSYPSMAVESAGSAAKCVCCLASPGRAAIEKMLAVPVRSERKYTRPSNHIGKRSLAGSLVTCVNVADDRSPIQISGAVPPR